MEAIFIWLGSMTLAGIIWGLRLEGRVNTNEKVTEVLVKDIVDRLTRIEAKQDAQNGHYQPRPAS